MEVLQCFSTTPVLLMPVLVIVQALYLFLSKCLCLLCQCGCLPSQLWQMVKDCNLHLCGMSLLDVSHLVDEWDGCGLNHAATLLMREFLQFLVKFSWSIHKGLTYTR